MIHHLPGSAERLGEERFLEAEAVPAGGIQRIEGGEERGPAREGEPRGPQGEYRLPVEEGEPLALAGVHLIRGEEHDAALAEPREDGHREEGRLLDDDLVEE